MTKVNGSGDNYVYYGGIKFNKDEVASVKNPKVDQFEVKLKTGQVLIFKDQTGSNRHTTNNPNFEPMVTASIEKDGMACLFGRDLSGVTIKGNPNKKDVIVIGGDHNLVYADNDNYADVVYTHDYLNGKDTNIVGLGNNDKWIDQNLVEMSKDNKGKISISIFKKVKKGL